MKNKKLLVILLCLILVVILAVLLFPTFKKTYVGKTIPVLVAKEDIGEGMLLSENMFKKQELPTDFVDEIGDYASLEDFSSGDRYAKHIILKREPLVKRKITSDQEKALYADQNLIAVTIDSISASVAAKISVGDHVSVRGYLTDEETGENIVFSPPELRNVEIAYIVNSDALDQGEDEEEKFIPKSVVFKIQDEKQVQELIRLEYSSKIHLERLSENQIRRMEEESTEKVKTEEAAESGESTKEQP